MSRQGLAFIGIAVGSALVLIQTWVMEDDYQSPWYVWVPIVAILLWSVWQLRERPDPKAKAFDFNPKRGVLYFFLGFLIFPITIGFDAVFGAGISLTGAALLTAGGSILVGLMGVFTEHVGV